MLPRVKDVVSLLNCDDPLAAALILADSLIIEVVGIAEVAAGPATFIAVTFILSRSVSEIGIDY